MKPFVIGVAGGSCSGKSTFARLLHESLLSRNQPARIIGLDSFYTRDMDHGPTLTLTTGEIMFDFNNPKAIDQDAAVSAIQSSAEPVVVVEGLFVLEREVIRSQLSHSVFLHLDADLRALRRLLRDMKGGRASTDPEFIARYYIESARVGHAKYVEPSKLYANSIVVGELNSMAAAVQELRALVPYELPNELPKRRE